MYSILWPIFVFSMFVFGELEYYLYFIKHLDDYMLYSATFRNHTHPETRYFEANNREDLCFMVSSHPLDGSKWPEPDVHELPDDCGYLVTVGETCTFFMDSYNWPFFYQAEIYYDGETVPSWVYNWTALFCLFDESVYRVNATYGRFLLHPSDYYEYKLYCDSIEYDFATLFTSRISVSVTPYNEPPLDLFFYAATRGSLIESWYHEYAPLKLDDIVPIETPVTVQEVEKTTVQEVEQTTKNTEIMTTKTTIELPWCEEKDYDNGCDRSAEWLLIWLGAIFFVHFVL